MIAIYLASQSPRRQELLRQINIAFEVLQLRQAPPRGPDVDESLLEDEPAEIYVERVAGQKALAGLVAVQRRGLALRPVLAADTVVVLDRQILGKPADAVEAAQFLRRLSGREHDVRTAVAIGLPGQDGLLRTTSVSTVRFRPLSEEEILAYAASGEPLDKAGGYGIQGRAATFAPWIAGSYSGIMGLPLAEVASLLGQAARRWPHRT